MVLNDSISTTLPPYPSTSARKTLSPSQLANLNETISSCLADVLSLSPAKRNIPAARAFISSYAKDVAVQTLEELIWDSGSLPSKVEKTIRTRVLQLTEKLVGELDVKTLMDLAIVYANTNPKSMRAVFEARSSILASTDLISPFILLLRFDNSPGLYTLRKASYCISSLLRVSPIITLRAFAHSKDFILAIAKVYQTGLSTIAHSYGGVNLTTPMDDWEKIWLQTKVSLMDSFHACMVCLLRDVASASGQALAMEAETAFDIVFSLLDLNTTNGQTRTPFLDQSILADYQQSYDLMRTLASSFRHAVERDARLDLLETSLKNLDTQSSSSEKNPGALRLLLRSSGIPPGIGNRGIGDGRRNGKQEAKEIYHSDPTPTSAVATVDPQLDIKISQVLDIFPDQPSDYIRDLLMHPSYPFAGNTDGAERVIGALLEGTAPPWDEVQNATKVVAASQKFTSAPAQRQPIERQNIFDEENVDSSNFRVGKKREDEHTFFGNRDFVEQMKADILRRVEEFSSSEDEDEDKAEDTEDEIKNIKVAGDGEESDAEESDEDNKKAPSALSLESILESAYIENPKLFNRDSATRSSKARVDLKTKTGWVDEQIEGWRIMLERDPKKKKLIMRKHEWSGNKPLPVVQEPESSSSAGGRGRGGGSGRGSNNSGRGRGRGGSGGPDARERAWKEKNKNKARRSGHDKKVARSGAGPPT